MTSLGQQLKKLAVPHTTALLGDQKQRPSLLFDKSEAATISKEALYSIGINGLQELQNIDLELQVYESKLFSEASLTFERTQHSKEVNDALDKTIEEYLIKVSPHFILRACTKTLEWLIYRYRINLTNVDAILTAFFPYYSDPTFVKLIQTLQLGKKNDRWHWLKPSKEHGTALSRATIRNQVVKDPNFLSFVCEIVSKHIKVHGSDDNKALKHVLLFTGSTLVGALSLGQIKETTISMLLPYLTEGLKSKCSDYKASSYILIPLIANAVKLEEKFLEKLMNAMTKAPNTLVKEMLSCLIVLCQCQNVKRFSKKTFRHICRVWGLTQHLENLAETYSIESFLNLFFARLVPAAVKESSSVASSSEGEDSDAGGSRPQFLHLLETLLLGKRLDHNVSVHVMKNIVEQYAAHSSSPEAVRGKICELFKTMEKKYPKAVDELLGTMTDDDSLKELVSSSGYNVIIGLNHTSADIRRISVEKIARGEVQVESVEELLVNRIDDDDMNVVSTVLNLENLNELVKESVFASAVMNLMDRKINDEDWRGVIVLCVQHLVAYWKNFSDEDREYWQVYMRVVPYILGGPRMRKNEVFDILMKSNVASKDPVFKEMSNLPGSVPCVGSSFCEALCRQSLDYQDKFMSNLLSMSRNELTSTVYEQVAVRILNKVIARSDDASSRLKSCKTILDIIRKTLLNFPGDFSVEVSSCSVFEVDSLSELCCKSLVVVISRMTLSDSLKKTKWWSCEEGQPDGLFILLILDLMRIISSCMSSDAVSAGVCEKIAAAMKSSCFSSPMMYFSLLGAVFSGQESITPVHQLLTLHYARTSLSKASAEEVEQLLSAESVTVPCILLALKSGYKPVRRAACSLMKAFVSTSTSSPFHVLCQKLLKVSDELKTSGEYLVQALSVIYVESMDNKKSRRKSVVAEAALLNLSLEKLIDVVCGDKCPYRIKEDILNSLELVQHRDVLIQLVPLLISLTETAKLETLSESETRCCHLLLQRFEPELAGLFHDNKPVKDCFFTCLKTSGGHHEDYLSIQKIALRKVTNEFYSSLPDDEIRHALFSHLLNVWVENENPDVNKTFNRKFKSLSVSVDHMSSELRKLLPATFSTVKETKRVRRRTNEARTGSSGKSVFDTVPWKRTILLLEIIQNKKKIVGIEKLAVDLFAILKFAIEQDNQSSADYFKQLVMSCLQIIYQSLSDHNVTSEQLKSRGAELNVELIIQSIRTSENAQTFHHALMLLSKAVQIDPEGVLHNVMSIFTFMGANVMRQDDSYSFSVLTDTIDNIIPALLNASPNDDEECSSELLRRLKIDSKLATSVKNILQVFVDTYTHIPLHRRLPLFENLMVNLKPNRFLWLLMVLMIDCHTVKRKDMQETDVANVPKVDEFCLNLCDVFDIQSRIVTAHKLLVFINTDMVDLEKKIETAKGKKFSSPNMSRLINFNKYKLKDVKMLKYGLVGLVAQLLSGVGGDKLDTNKDEKLVKTFEKTMEECLIFITTIGRAMALESNNYWQALLTGSYKILDQLQSLLKHSVFVKVINGLLVNDLAVIRRKTMELLVNKLSTPKFSCEPDQVETYLSLMPQLAKAARSSPRGEDVNVGTANRQAALLALRAVCRCFGQQNPKQFQQLLPLVSKLISDQSPVGVKSSAVALLAELITCLRAHAVSSLSSFMPALIQILQLHRQNVPGADTLLPNTIAVVQKIVEVLPNFISPYLCDLLVDIFWLSSRYSQQDAEQKMHVAHRLQLVRKHLSKDIPTRNFLPNLTKSYDELSSINQWRSIQPIMSTLSDHISNMSPEDVTSHHGSIATLFLTAMDMRVHAKNLSLIEIKEIEKHISQAVSSLVMKLSESTFRPLFYRLYDWATNPEAAKDRLLTFYHLCDCLASKMKNLFAKFAGHVLQNVAVILDANNTEKTKDDYFTGENAIEKSCELIVVTMDVLYQCFLYDNEGFVTKERFDTLMPPLVAQLENMLGGTEVYRERVSGHLVDCLVQLAVAAGDDGSWKPLNYQVCLKTRHSDPTIRFAALQVLESLHDKLGADYISMLPETIQFLAELTEDENYEVEQKCHEVIKKLEKTLGEPLSKYF